MRITPSHNHWRGLGWFVLSLVVSCANDTLTKHLCQQLDPWQVSFFRLAYGALILLPLLLYRGKKAFRTNRLSLHILRGALFFVALVTWGHGVSRSPITTATVMSFTVPVFVLLLAPIMLRERVTLPLWIATLGGFIGIIIAVRPSTEAFNAHTLLFVAAAMLFGILDVLNRKYVSREPMSSMLFYSTLTAAFLTLVPALQHWSFPSPSEHMWLAVLGIGGNLILYFLLKAFALTSATLLAPIRYVELLISIGAGYIFFGELPSTASFLGALFIIPCTLFIVYQQNKTRRSN